MANSDSAWLAFIGRYRKSITAFVGGAISVATYFGVDNSLIQVGVAFATALGVYAVPNVTPFLPHRDKSKQAAAVDIDLSQAPKAA